MIAAHLAASPPEILLVGFPPDDEAASRAAIRTVLPRIGLRIVPAVPDLHPVLAAVAPGAPIVACLCAACPGALESLALLRRQRPTALVALALGAGDPVTASGLCLFDDVVRTTAEDLVRLVVLVRRAVERADAERSRGDRETLRLRRDELDRAARRYRAIAEQAEQPIATFDDDDRIDYVNPAMAALTGYAADDLLGRPCADLFFEEDRAEAAARAARRKRGWRDKAQFRVRRRDGSEVWVEATGAPMYDVDGRVIGRLSMVTDITARRADDQRVRQALADREALLREVHHRVRNNFQIISSLFNLEFHDLDHPELRGRIRDTQNRIATMALLHSLLYESHDLATARADLYLRQVVEGVCRSYDQTGGPVSILVDADRVGLSTDNGMRFGLIVNELVTNALKYAFPGGRAGTVRVRLRRQRDSGDDAHVVLEVADDGVGIGGGPPAAGRGLGLGLGLVRDMVAQLDGTIALATGRGTTVRMSFPAARVTH